MNKNNINCPNKNCKYYNKKNAGNIKVKQTQGKCEDIDLCICTECNTTFSERHGTVFFRIQKSITVFILVMKLLVCKISIRCIPDITGVSEKTIRRWLKKASKFLKAFNDFYVKDLEVNECQIDEMWSFVLMKNKTAVEKGIKDKSEIGDQWIFIALDASKKLVIHWQIGKRTYKNAEIFISELKNKYKSNPLFTTDGWECYEKAFLENFKLNGNEDTKTAISDTHGEEKISPDLKYARVEKKREKGKVVEINKKIIFGNSDWINEIIKESNVSNEINTTFVERYNGTARAKNSRLVRKTYSFSKNLKYHKAHIDISFVWYNFISIHSRLKKTAAQLAGLFNKALTFKDIFQYRTYEFC